MIYRIYVRYPANNRVVDKTVTPYTGVAEQAFRLILRRATLGFFDEGAEAALTLRGWLGDDRVVSLEVIPLDRSDKIKPAMTLRLFPPGSPTGLALPGAYEWPIDGRDKKTGDIILRERFVDDLETSSGLLPYTLTEETVMDFLISWYASRQKMGGEKCPVMEEILRDIENEEGATSGSLRIVVPQNRPNWN